MIMCTKKGNQILPIIIDNKNTIWVQLDDVVHVCEKLESIFVEIPGSNEATSR